MNYTHEVTERKDKRVSVAAVMPRESPSDDDWTVMRKYIEGRGMCFQTAKHNGWFPSRTAGDRVLRIVMPATNTGNLCYWQARSLTDAEPRYQSPPVPRGDSVIQVWALHDPEYSPLTILCEGPFDALAAASHGIRGIALMGNNPTADTMSMISKLITADDHVTYFADRDSLKEAVLIASRLHRIGIYATVSDPSPYKDLACIPKGQRDTILKMFLLSCRSTHSMQATKGRTVNHDH